MMRWSISGIIPAVLMLMKSMTVYYMTLILLFREQPGFQSAQFKLQHSKPCDEQKKNDFSLTSSSGAKKRAKEAFFRKWEKCKALESILNAGNFDINLEGLDICGDKDEGLSSEGQKSVVDFDKPITAVEERHHSDSTVEGAFFKKSLASETVCPPLSKSSLGDTVPTAQ